MRAVKGKNNILNLISRDEASLFNKTEFNEFLDISTLSERDLYIAEELYKKNVLKKVRRGESIGYKVYPQKTQL